MRRIIALCFAMLVVIPTAYGAITDELSSNSKITGSSEPKPPELSSYDYSRQPSINPGVSQIVENWLTVAVEEFHAHGAFGLIVNIKSGEIVAASSVSSRATKGECRGAAVCKASDQIIHSMVEWPEVLRLVVTANKLERPASEPAALRKLLNDLGQISPINTGADETPSPLYPQKMTPGHIAALELGHWLVNSPLHAVAAFMPFINGGIFVAPTFQKRAGPAPEKRVISAEIAAQIRCQLITAPSDASPLTADWLQHHGVVGTSIRSEKIKDGHYLPYRFINAYIGAYPYRDPQFVYLVAVDEPQLGVSDDAHRTLASAAELATAVIVETAEALNLSLNDVGHQSDCSQ